MLNYFQHFLVHPVFLPPPPSWQPCRKRVRDSRLCLIVALEESLALSRVQKVFVGDGAEPLGVLALFA